jgi:hypothetical protein
MRKRSCQLPHHTQAVHVGEIGFELAESLVLLLCASAFRQIEHIGNRSTGVNVTI